MRVAWARAAAVVLAAALQAAPASAQERRAGIGVDSQGGSVIDPTENVKALNSASERRLDDLRKAQADLDSLRFSHLQDLMSLRAEYEEKLRAAEAKRIDAIRAVDTTNATAASERAVSTATTLAKTFQDQAQVLSAATAKSADDLRTLVATTAQEASRNLQQQFAAITTRLSALEQGSVNTSGVGAGRSDVVGWIFGGLGLLAALTAAFVTLARRRR